MSSFKETVVGQLPNPLGTYSLRANHSMQATTIMPMPLSRAHGRTILYVHDDYGACVISVMPGAAGTGGCSHQADEPSWHPAVDGVTCHAGSRPAVRRA